MGNGRACRNVSYDWLTLEQHWRFGLGFRGTWEFCHVLTLAMTLSPPGEPFPSQIPFVFQPMPNFGGLPSYKFNFMGYGYHQITPFKMFSLVF